MKIKDTLNDISFELRTNYLLQRTLADASKDLVKGALVGAGLGLLANYFGLKKNGFPKSVRHLIVDADDEK